MTTKPAPSEYILPLADPEAALESAGGKGSVLARLYQAGFPVPDGFVIPPRAFDGDKLRPEAWAQTRARLDHLRASEAETAFAVRSSALSEDSARASFAGEFETVLNLGSDEAIHSAILSVRRSRHSERVRVYSQAQGISFDHEMAVVVQRMVPAVLSGVLFSADPVSGSRVQMSGDFVRGLGEELVSGSAGAASFTLRRPNGGYEGPPEVKAYARALFKLAMQLEAELGGPQDIEWALSGGKLYLLQSRPITTLSGHNPATGEWNDSLTGDYLWSSVNFGEAVTEAMTPLTWSLIQFTLEDWVFLHGFSTTGNIGGYPYLNISLFMTLFRLLGRGRQDLFAMTEGTLYMRLPDEMQIPLIPLSRREIISSLWCALRTQIRQRRGLGQLPEYLERNPADFSRMRSRIRAEQTQTGLRRLWVDEIGPHIRRGAWIVLGTVSHSSDYTMRLRRELVELAGPHDASLLIANLSEDNALLPSLGPVAGLAKVARGELDRQAYLEAYGHRGPHEFEVSKPRPLEDPVWLDQQLAEFRATPVDAEALLDQGRAAFGEAWERLCSRRPRQAKALRCRIDESARRARLREQARSEYIRDRWLARIFALHAGELTGQGERVFYLSLDELLGLLSGDERAVAFIPARRETHRRYQALPPYPSIIRGRFDPFQWVADPQRRSDIFDPGASLPAAAAESGAIIHGSPGSAGRVEGRVRLLESPDQGRQLQEGEILVAVQTDVAWTLVFPRAAAVVTDIGAPLSHAAIVARELGIPAVVGCGDATTRLKTGDRARVDGGRGVVEILESA